MKQIVRPVDEVLREDPSAANKISWKSNIHLVSPVQAHMVSLTNPEFGKLDHVFVCTEDGTPLYDRYVIRQVPGTIIVPYDDQFRVALMDQYRPGHQNPFTSLPMGFTKLTEKDQREAGVRELREELGIEVLVSTLVDLGPSNLDPPSHLSFDRVYEVHCTIPEETRDGHEGIVRVKPYGFKEIIASRKAGKLTDGLTNSAILMYGTQHPEFFQT